MNKMVDAQKDPRIRHLAGKMVDGSRALDDFFKTLLADREKTPAELAGELTAKYDLTPNQQSYLGRVAERTTTAKGIVRYLENRFGMNPETGRIQNPRGLYRFLTDKKAPGDVSGFSKNIAIEVTNGVWEHEDKIGFVQGEAYDTLSFPPEHNRALMELDIPPDLSSIAYYLPKPEHFQERERKARDKDADALLVRAIFGKVLRPEEYRQEVVEHEQRHIFDRQLGKPVQLPETVAHFYSGKTHCEKRRGFGRDQKRGQKDPEQARKYRMFKERIKKLKELHAPRRIIEDDERSLELYKGRMEIASEEIEAIEALELKDEHLPLLSYVISTTGLGEKPGRIAHRVALAEEILVEEDRVKKEQREEEERRNQERYQRLQDLRRSQRGGRK